MNKFGVYFVRWNVCKGFDRFAFKVVIGIKNLILSVGFIFCRLDCLMNWGVEFINVGYFKGRVVLVNRCLFVVEGWM